MAVNNNLGKVMAKVELSDAIPGVERDPRRLRKSYAFTVDWPQPQQETSYGVITINVPGPRGSSISGCIMPEPLYVPLDNHLQGDMTTTANSSYDDVFWKPREIFVKPDDDDDDDDDAESYYDLTKSGSSTFTAIVSNADDLASKQTKEDGPIWKEDALPIRSDNVIDIDDQYFSYPIKYRAEEEFQSLASAESGTEDNSSAEDDNSTDSATTLDASASSNMPEHKIFLSQKGTEPSVWWAVQTARDFKEKGWPFWVEIRNHSVNVRRKNDGVDNSLSHPLICIKIRDGRTSRETNRISSSKSHVGDVELIITGTGKSYVQYQVKTSSVNYNSSTNSTSRASITVWKRADVKLPGLFDALKPTSTAIIGFMSILGRLIIYDGGSGQYSVVSFVGGDSNESLLGFNLDTLPLLICGYGCSVAINASRMTFPKRGFYVLNGLQEDATGYYMPPYSENGMRAGSLSDGRLVSRPVTREMYEGARSRGRGGRRVGKQYGASFKHYQESLYTPPKNNTARGSIDSDRANSTGLNLSSAEDNFSNGMYNMWGLLHLVRHDTPIPSIAGDKKFWFVYFETETLKMDGRKSDNSPDSEHSVSSRTGFPMFYNMVAKEESSKEPSRPTRNRTTTITDHITQISVDHSLDSPRPTYVESKATVKVFNVDGQYEEFLAKARGIKIWMKWSLSETVEYSDDDLVFSGVAFGRTKDQSPGEEYITFDCLDHWHVLQSMQIKNSLFYDGFEIGMVVQDLCAKVGVEFKNEVDKSQAASGGPMYYWLGQGISHTKPLYRFSSEKSIKDCALEAINNFEVMLRFDEDATLTLLPVPGGFLWENDNSLWNPNPKETYYTDIDSIDEYYQLIIDNISISSTLSSSIYNSFFLMSVDRYTGALVVRSSSLEGSLLKPDQIGYLGFIREMRQQKPDLGGVGPAMDRYLQLMLEKYGTPGFEVQFQTPGHVTSYYPGEFINLKEDKISDGVAEIFNKRFRVTKIGHEYDSESGRWTTDVSAYQIDSDSFKPSRFRT